MSIQRARPDTGILGDRLQRSADPEPQEMTLSRLEQSDPVARDIHTRPTARLLATHTSTCLLQDPQ
ncbi:hypothetical protein GCM10011610_68100 [Nocardia rhizosphaerihabitans]|uniref:Uncharacterized protein n=1 Tax=Nocardia rhizosphaerihabitans TaxID=1691570 RepID=A0ABQ2L1Z4_9NOCA|nr:hypothetical protein GCM10011610_68100 [Nocardia rhizosphaerihabitans]